MLLQLIPPSIHYVCTKHLLIYLIKITNNQNTTLINLLKLNFTIFASVCAELVWHYTGRRRHVKIRSVQCTPCSQVSRVSMRQNLWMRVLTESPWRPPPECRGWVQSAAGQLTIPTPCANLASVDVILETVVEVKIEVSFIIWRSPVISVRVRAFQYMIIFNFIWHIDVHVQHNLW